ncbi:MAG: hypothetical protein AAB662_02630 [Patescibacteria group bacterium]
MFTVPFISWLSQKIIIGGDWRFFWPENIAQILTYSFSWDSSLNTGIGQSNFPILWLNSYLGIVGNFLSNTLHIPWVISEKLMFFWPIIIFSFLSAFFLSRLVTKQRGWNVLSGLVYLLNTYALMIFSGGQVGVALAYAVSPFVLLVFVGLINEISEAKSIPNAIRKSIMAGMVLALVMLFDPRIALLNVAVIILYFIFNFSLADQVRRKAIVSMNNLFYAVITTTTVILLNSFWILPIIWFGINPVKDFTSAFGSAGIARFLSFAQFENSFSLLHPNWPENIFGKVYFLRPEFLIMPILAFLSLVFIKNENGTRRKYILFFSFLALAGAFLAKGTNPPFGEFYSFLISNIPGFSMYRDSTKWYTLVAISYSVLIPFSIGTIYNLIKSQSKFQNLFLIFTALCLIFLIRPAFEGQIGGTFKKHDVPKEYSQIKDYISNQDNFFRTVWVPEAQRYTFFSNDHPIISANTLFKTSSPSAVVTLLTLSSTQALLQEAAVKYVIVPYDVDGEIFLSDRKYDEKAYEQTVSELKNIRWLKHILNYGKIAIFEVPNPKNHFWSQSQPGLTITFKKINPTEYLVNVENAKQGEELVFSEGYDRYWAADINGKRIFSKRFHTIFNSFILPENGKYSIRVLYLPQEIMPLAFFISTASFILAIITLSYFAIKAKH